MSELEPGMTFKYNPNKQIKKVMKLVDNQMKIIYYLAFPYSGMNIEDVMQIVAAMRFKLEQRGLTVFSPLHHSHNYSSDIPSQQDLIIMEALSNGDGHDGKEVYINNTTCKAWQCPMWDSGEIILMSHTAYEFHGFGGINAIWKSYQENLISETDWKSYWFSDGCRQEYEKAKSKFIRVFEAEAFVFDGVEVDL